MHDSSNIQYELKFAFWASVDASSLKVEHRPAGKINFVINKLNKPARWRQLYMEGTQKPQGMKLDIGKHEREHYLLWEFEEDSIVDFEGHEMF